MLGPTMVARQALAARSEQVGPWAWGLLALPEVSATRQGHLLCQAAFSEGYPALRTAHRQLGPQEPTLRPGSVGSPAVLAPQASLVEADRREAVTRRLLLEASGQAAAEAEGAAPRPVVHRGGRDTIPHRRPRLGLMDRGVVSQEAEAAEEAPRGVARRVTAHLLSAAVVVLAAQVAVVPQAPVEAVLRGPPAGGRTPIWPAAGARPLHTAGTGSQPRLIGTYVGRPRELDSG